MQRAALLLLLAICHSALAEDIEPPAQQAMVTSVWINPGFYSYHFDRSKNLREDNYGLGTQVTFSPTNSIVGGEFQNSDNAHSRYLGWAWQPYQLGSTRLGVWVGAIDGYPGMNDGRWFMAVIPMLSFEYKSVGFNLTAFPNYENKLYAALVLQLKLRVWEP